MKKLVILLLFLSGFAASAQVITRPLLYSKLDSMSQSVATAILGKVDKIAGKKLSTKDYTSVDSLKLAGIQAGATANSTDAQLRDRSTHTGVQVATTITQDGTHRFVTDAEKNAYGLKIGPGDTANMLSAYRGAINTTNDAISTVYEVKVGYDDTAAMFAAHPGGAPDTIKVTAPLSITSGVKDTLKLDTSGWHSTGYTNTIYQAKNDTARTDIATAINLRLKTSDTAAMFLAHPGGIFDTTSKFTAYQNAINGRATVANLALKLNISDTAAMHTAYQNGLNARTVANALKLNISDTAAMFSAHPTAAADSIKVVYPLSVVAGVVDSIKIDTTVWHSTPYHNTLYQAKNDTARADITAALLARTILINGKEGSITATTSADYYRGDKTFQPLNKAAVGLGSVVNTDTTRSDYQAAINLRLKIADTAAMFVAHPGGVFDTTSKFTAYQNAINLLRSQSLKYTDSATMLTPYQTALLARLLKSDTSTFLSTYANAINARAPINSPAFTGTPAAPTATPGTNTTQVATTAFVNTTPISDWDLIRPALGSTTLWETPWKFDQITQTTNLSDGFAYYYAIYIRNTTTITGVKFFLATQGAFTGDNYNGVGLFSYSGGTLTLVASSTDDGGALWKQTGGAVQLKAFSSTYSAAPGIYYVSFVYNQSSATTAPSLSGATNMVALGVSAMDFTNSAGIGMVKGPTTAFPATIAASAMGGKSQNRFWLALY